MGTFYSANLASQNGAHEQTWTKWMLDSALIIRYAGDTFHIYHLIRCKQNLKSKIEKGGLINDASLV
ncbi:MAG: hypothetical protein DPW09_45975 [Anaerolineae bacterium]|nr:hypothetical protein [Anaerolineae bacterium]GIK39654.1 MAG: hypothetical protein BroJett011_34870 [Chloroflexota bacterium]